MEVIFTDVGYFCDFETLTSKILREVIFQSSRYGGWRNPFLPKFANTSLNLPLDDGKLGTTFETGGK